MVVALDDVRSVVKEVIHNLAITPSSILIEQSQRCVPVEQHRSDLEALVVQFGNDIVVVLHAFLIHGSLAEREDTRPRDREAERRHSEVLQASKVLSVQPVVGRCYVGGGIVGYLVDNAVAEEVPDRWAFAFRVCGALAYG